MRRILHGLILTMSAGFLGCSGSDAPADLSLDESVSRAIEDTETVSDVSTDGEALTRRTFGDVLSEYEALNARLERVSYRLRRDNAELCPQTVRDIGAQVHTIYDYPEDLHPIAEAIMGVNMSVSVRTLRPNSPAVRAGLRVGDIIRQVGDMPVKIGRAATATYYFATQTKFLPDTAYLTVERNGQPIEKAVQPETICAYPALVFFSDNVNGHTDGEEVWITSELMKTVPDDVNLAVVVAHEMSHAIAGHLEQVPSQDLELLADRMALVMLARADFDIKRAIDYWQTAPHPHGSGQPGSLTHPTMGARFTNFQRTYDRIINARSNGQSLDFSLAEEE